MAEETAGHSTTNIHVPTCYMHIQDSEVTYTITISYRLCELYADDTYKLIEVAVSSVIDTVEPVAAMLYSD